MTFPAKWVQPANWFSTGFINQNDNKMLAGLMEIAQIHSRASSTI